MNFLYLLKKGRYTFQTLCHLAARGISCATLLFSLFILNSQANAQGITGVNSLCVGSSSLLSITSIGGTWSSSNTAVVSVSSAGLITGVGAGAATITYSLLGIPITLGVTVNPQPNAGTISGGTQVCVGNTITLSSSGDSGGGWSTLNNFASVGSTGIVTGQNIGSETIKYTVVNGCGTAISSKTISVVGQVNHIYTLAGTGTGSFSGDGGPAYQAAVNNPRDLVTDTSGNVYFCDLSNNRIRKITKEGIITTIAGTGISGNTGDGGPATAATLNVPNGVFIDNSGVILLSNTGSNTIRRINSLGIISTIAGVAGSSDFSGDGGPATAAKLFSPLGVLEDPAGNIYIGDQGNNRIRRIDANTGIITTVAGNGSTTYRSADDGGPATAAQLSVRGITIDRDGNIYIADAMNNRVRKLVPATGIITTFAGTGVGGHTGDGGPASAATLSSPARFAYDGANILYINDQNSQLIRQVNMTNWTISSVAGNATAGFSGDGGLATAAQFRAPVGIAADHFGNFFVADANNARIRVVNSRGSVAITSNGPTKVCAGSTVTLNALSSETGNMTIQWQKNGSNVGGSSTTYVETSPTDGDVYRCVITVTPPCGSWFTDTSNIITLIVDPVVSGITGLSSDLCIGSTATLSNSASGGTWTSSSSGVASIGSGGVLTGISAGTAVITYAVPNTCGTNTATLTVNIASPGTITSSAVSNGSILPSGTTTLCGGDQAYTMTPATGYHIDDVTVDGSSVGAVSTYTFTSVSSGHTINASFAINIYSITATAGSNGSISPSGTSTVNYGAANTYSITPSAGYHISDVSVDGSSVGIVSAYTFSSVSAGHTISASFAINTYNIVATCGTNGSISPSGTSTFDYGTDATYAVTPAAGYHIIDVLIDGASVGAVSSYTFSAVSTSHTISATFAINTFTITATCGSTGTISPAGAITVDWGDNAVYSITPDAGYYVSDVTVDGVSIGAVTSYTFAGINTNHVVVASFAINTYTITATSGSNGTIAPVGASVVSYGDAPVFTVTPNTGYHISDVLVDGASVGAVTSYTFTPVSSDHTIAATFVINSYSVTASTGSNGTITPSGTSVVNYGDAPTYAIAAATGYHIADVLVDGVSAGAVSSYTFGAVSADHTISASFAINTYSVTASAGSGGTITPSGTSVVNYGDVPSYVIAPGTGYHIADVLVDGSSVGAVSVYTFSPVSNGHTISATFAINTYSITASAGAAGSISPSGTTSVTYGGNETYMITPSAGYGISAVTVDGVNIGAVSSYTFTAVAASHTISATFAASSFSITASAGSHGTISPSGTTSVSAGSSQTYTITPASGYHISCVTVDGSIVGAVASYTFSSVSASHTISATFASGGSHTIVASAGSHGSISPSGSTSVSYGGSQSYTMTPSTNYHVNCVTVDGSSVGAVSTYTFTSVTANHTISATFAVNTYTITASAGSHGTISPSGATTVSAGDNQTYTIAPASGYHISDVTVDGVSVGAVTSYTFSSVAAGHTISATFAYGGAHTITASACSHGSISPSGTTTVSYGGSQAYTITPSTGYRVTSVTVDGSSVGAVSTYTFTAVTANHTISATFAINTYTITASAGSHGSISPSGANVVTDGSSQAFSITAACGYHVSSVIVDGTSVGALTSYTFTSVHANHSISATFTTACGDDDDDHGGHCSGGDDDDHGGHCSGGDDDDHGGHCSGGDDDDHGGHCSGGDDDDHDHDHCGGNDDGGCHGGHRGSAPVAVAIATDHILVFPNPNTGIFNISVPADQKEALVVIVDMSGKTIMSKAITQNSGKPVQISLGSVAKGTYIVNIKAGKYSTSDRVSVE